MKIAICQSNYLPWRGYFDMIAMCDAFVFHDDIQYTKQDWRNRNLLKMPDGVKWITVPVKKGPVDITVDRVQIDQSVNWQFQHETALRTSLGAATYFQDAFDLFESRERTNSLSALNQSLIRSICGYLGIKTRLINARELGCIGRKTEKILSILHAAGAGPGDVYLSGPAARQYLDVGLMQSVGIGVEWKDYSYIPYSQRFGDFEGNVSILDLIANVGPYARHLITSVPEKWAEAAG